MRTFSDPGRPASALPVAALPVLPPLKGRRRRRRLGFRGSIASLHHPLCTLHDVRCRTPCNTRSRLAGCAFAGQVLNLLARGEKFQLIASPFPGLALALPSRPTGNRTNRFHESAPRRARVVRPGHRFDDWELTVWRSWRDADGQFRLWVEPPDAALLVLLEHEELMARWESVSTAVRESLLEQLARLLRAAEEAGDEGRDTDSAGPPAAEGACVCAAIDAHAGADPSRVIPPALRAAGPSPDYSRSLLAMFLESSFTHVLSATSERSEQEFRRNTAFPA